MWETDRRSGSLIESLVWLVTWPVIWPQTGDAGQALAIGLAGGANKGPNAHRVELRGAGVKPIFGEARKRVPGRNGLTLGAEFRRLSDCRVLRRCGSAQPRVSGSRFRPAD